MNDRRSTKIILAISASLLLAATPPTPIRSTTTTADSEQSFVARSDRWFGLLAHGGQYITASGLGAEFGSNARRAGGEQLVPLPRLEARFSCIDVNKDGRISAKEYRDFARAVFKLASVKGVLNLARAPDIIRYQNALKSCALSS